MLTSFDQVREWITDNGFKRWVLYRDRSKTEKILDSASFASDIEDKLAMTEKYLRLSGGSAYAAGGQSGATTDLTTTCEIRLEQPSVTPLQTAGVAGGIGEAQLRETIRKELEAEWDKREYKRLRDELDKERKEFEEDKRSAIGLVTDLLAPVGKALLEKKRLVAGLDTNEPVHAQPIVPDDEPHDAQESAPENENEPSEVQEETRPLTDEEEEQAYDLLVRFKRVEPRYLELLSAVVEMAESGDARYALAKGGLLK